MNFLRAGVLVIATRCFAAMGGLVFFTLLARHLGPEGFGTASVALTIVTVSGLFMQVGLPTYLAKEASLCDAGQVSNVLSAGLTSIITHLPIVAALVLGGHQILGLGDHIPALDLVVFGVLIFFCSASSLSIASVIRARGALVVSTLGENVARPFILIVTTGLILFVLADADLTLQTVLAITLFASFSAMLTVVVITREVLSISAADMLRKTCELPDWHNLMPLGLYGLIQGLAGNFEILIAGLMLPSSEVGHLKAALQVGSVAMLGLTALNQMVAPSVARLQSATNKAALQVVLLRHAALISFVSTLPCAIFLIFAENIVVFVLGDQYEPAAVALRFVAGSHLINLLFGPTGMLLNMTNNAPTTLRWLSYGLLLGALFGPALGYLLGLQGIGIAMLATSMLWNVGLRIEVKKRLSVESSGAYYCVQVLLLRLHSNRRSMK